MYPTSSADEPKRESAAGGTKKAHRRSRSIDSQDLFGGDETLLIHHIGVTYTLRKTRNGKLILNK
jgi:hemin uptake protein HemP